ncbi:hypothetical protein ASD11_01170 [Aeromicrobium sp. Root495]|uniref:hypothetical protein n=1 Tax=Aeromicrobium sp. Root495 TaxID=1736550 RepID=UPI0006FABB11|nr:hypothetical protein [Aeromicrobium sp. Root495]KQY58306.1 hypothetical protein ASD11_01170 [Aeromicrobium sp. Root495]
MPAPDVSSNPWVIYAAIVAAVLVAAATASENLAKIFGRFGRGYYDYAERRREAAVERRGVEYANLAATVRRLDGQVGKLERDRVLRDAENSATVARLEGEVVAWRAWAFEVRKAAAAEGITLPEPPAGH